MNLCRLKKKNRKNLRAKTFKDRKANNQIW